MIPSALPADGELRQPGSDIMRKLSGAKEKLGLRVHGLIIGTPEKRRADPAVLRGLCTNHLPNGKIETLISEFDNWSSVQVTRDIDWFNLGECCSMLLGVTCEKSLLRCSWFGAVHTTFSPSSICAFCLQADASMKFDWDDAEGNARRRLAGLALEKRRQEESRRKKKESKQQEKTGMVAKRASAGKKH